jgi:hypothetical protein
MAQVTEEARLQTLLKAKLHQLSLAAMMGQDRPEGDEKKDDEPQGEGTAMIRVVRVVRVVSCFIIWLDAI